MQPLKSPFVSTLSAVLYHSPAETNPGNQRCPLMHHPSYRILTKLQLYWDFTGLKWFHLPERHMWLINIAYIDSGSNMETRCMWRRLHLQEGTKNGKEVKPIDICIKFFLKEWNWLFDCLQPSKKTKNQICLHVSVQDHSNTMGDTHRPQGTKLERNGQHSSEQWAKVARGADVQRLCHTKANTIKSAV